MVDLEDRSTTIVVDPDLGLLRVTLSGRYDLRSWIELIQGITSVPGYEPGMNALYDAREAQYDFSRDDVRHLAEWIHARLDEWGEGWRHATIVSTDVMDSLTRTVGSWFEDAPFQAAVFREEDDAVRWLTEDD